MCGSENQVCLRDNVMKINEFSSETILDGSDRHVVSGDMWNTT
jgi:hypothetical protein